MPGMGNVLGGKLWPIRHSPVSPRSQGILSQTPEVSPDWCLQIECACMNPEKMQRRMIKSAWVGVGWRGSWEEGALAQPGKINADLPSGWGRGRSILAGRENTGSGKGRS